MASGNSIDGIEVEETSFNMKSDESKGTKEGSGDEEGMRRNIFHLYNVYCISYFGVCVSEVGV
jgi:hypothetical protein